MLAEVLGALSADAQPAAAINKNDTSSATAAAAAGIGNELLTQFVSALFASAAGAAGQPGASSIPLGGMDASPFTTSSPSSSSSSASAATTATYGGEMLFTTLLLGNPFFTAGISLMVITYMTMQARNMMYYCCSSIRERFFFSMRVDSKDDSFQWLIEWFASQPRSKRASDFTLQTIWSRNRYNPYYVEDNDRGEGSSRPTVLKIPSPGSYFFHYRGSLVWFSWIRKQSKDMTRYGALDESITITTIGLWSAKDLLMQILHEAMERSFAKSESKTWIYTVDTYDHYWRKACSRQKRRFESVILDEGVKDMLLADARRFLASRDWYTSLGIPWRRGYLLYGPPGSGKSSFILALAAELNASLCICNLASPNMCDDRITGLFATTPKNSIILLEDIDAVFVKHMKNTDGGDHNRTNTLSFSGLLNAIDGVSAQEGRMLFMTTNHIDRLSPALIRPGRIDVKACFDLASKYQIRKMFERFYGVSATAAAAGAATTTTSSSSDIGSEGDLVIKIGERLADAIGDRKISTAQLQNFFMQHRNIDAPDELLDHVQAFLEQCEKESRGASDDYDDHISNSTEEKKDKNNKKKNKDNNDEDSSRLTTTTTTIEEIEKRKRLMRRKKRLLARLKRLANNDDDNN